MVALKEPVQVVKVGYEVGRDEIMEQLAREASPVPADAPTGFEGDYFPFKDFVFHVVSGHNLLWKYWNDRENFRKHLDSLLGDALGSADIGEVLQSIDMAVVRRMVRARVRQELVGNRKRILWTEPIEGDADESWRGPWAVRGWRMATTGTYTPGYGGGYGGGEDEEGPSIRNVKHHVLLLVEWVGEGGLRGGSYVVEKGNTYPWTNVATANTLMEEDRSLMLVDPFA
jgi:hypothetical protein